MAETRPPKEAKKADKTTPARARNGPKPPLIRYPADQPTGVFAVMNQANDAFHIGALASAATVLPARLRSTLWAAGFALLPIDQKRAAPWF
jgi:hypothetical protein